MDYKKYKTIGIIGGQGPASTIDFYESITKYFQDEYGARYVKDFPRMIIYSWPTPNLIDGVEQEEETYALMADALYGLEREGADFVIITCISLQYFIDRLQPLVSIPIIPITPLLTDEAKSKGYKSVGILATGTTVNKRICHNHMEKHGVRVINPTAKDQKDAGEVVLDVIGGRITPKDKKILQRISKNLGKKGADAILLACTEFPLVIQQADIDIPLIDCNKLYPKVVAKYAAGDIDKVVQ